MDGFTGGGGISRMDVENSPDAHKPVEISDSGFLTIRERRGSLEVQTGPPRPLRGWERLFS